MKKLFVAGFIAIYAFFLYSCGGGNTTDPAAAFKEKEDDKTENGNPSYDPTRGEGKFTKIDVGPGLDAAMAVNGEKVYGVKCSSCHKLTEEKLVGPGWKGVTSRHTGEWIMNFVTNTDAMITKDPAAQAQLEICLVRMPNQNLADEDARSLYEFMRKNDGIK